VRGDRTSDYDFSLPPELVAQEPPAVRGASRLMIVDRDSGAVTHHDFAELARIIPAGDVLVRNTTRVRRARLLGTRPSGAPAEILLLRLLGDTRWEAMVHPGGKLRPGRVVRVSDQLDVRVLEVTDRRTRVVELVTPLAPDDAIERFGHVPLPPYIARPDAAPDAERYQTVYAREPGSVAAPTAGLHFTPELLAQIEAGGVHIADVLLHVGAGTFRPVEHEDPSAHVMHEEWYDLPAGTAATVNAARDAGHHVWAIGTTSTRTLESGADGEGRVAAARGETRLFIRPGYRFRVVDRLLTNFHLPRSTLLMLVAAFAGYDLAMHAYQVAVAARYRFYSYGDAMLIR